MEREHEFESNNNFTELQNCLAIFDPVKQVNEKFKGRFNLKMNSQLPMSVKIRKLSGDPLAFHMHKNRQFVHKLQKKNPKMESIDEVSRKMAEEM